MTEPDEFAAAREALGLLVVRRDARVGDSNRWQDTIEAALASGEAAKKELAELHPHGRRAGRAEGDPMSAKTEADRIKEALREARPAAIGIRDEVAVFAQAMEEKLRENDYKSHWSGLTVQRLHGGLKQGLAELDNELVKKHPDPRKVLRKSADVANFLMMIADNVAEGAQ